MASVYSNLAKCSARKENGGGGGQGLREDWNRPIPGNKRFRAAYSIDKLQTTVLGPNLTYILMPAIN